MEVFFLRRSIYLMILFITKNLCRSFETPGIGDNENGLFYMYDLNEEFWWRWPNDDANCSSNGYIGHEHRNLSGMGIPIAPEQGLFLSWHFSMFSSLYNRYKRSSRRTFDPQKASVFIIPYDLGLDGYVNKETCEHKQAMCTPGLVNKLQYYLLNNNNSYYWKRYQGLDHVVLWSLGQYHPWPIIGCNKFMKTFCAKCTITCYWMDSTKADNRFVSLPFPSAYHWWEGIRDVPWVTTSTHIKQYEHQSFSLSNKNNMNKYENVLNKNSKYKRNFNHIKETLYVRNITAVYVGSAQTLTPAYTKIRKAMVLQCRRASSHCQWRQIAHSSKDKNIGEYLTIYRHAIFCLCPPGDDPARKAVFDAILSGCIPVIFEKSTLYNQYPWHIGENTALDISVSIPGNQLKKNQINFMLILRNISRDVILRKQQAIEKLAPRVQYSMPPLHYLENKYDNTKWDPPFQDAADVALKGFISRVNSLLHNKSTNIPPNYMLKHTWKSKYEHQAIIQLPNN